MSGDRDIDTSQLRAAFVQAQAQIMNNGTYEPVVVISKPLALSLLAEIERLRAEVQEKRVDVSELIAQIGRRDDEFLRLRAAGDAMAEALRRHQMACGVNDASTAVAAWREGRRER